MATIDYKQLATPEANLIELLAAQNQDGTYTAKLMGSEPFAVLAAKTIYNAYNDIEDNMAADVEGPATSTDNAVVRFDGTTGKLIKNSNAILTDAGALSLASNLTVSGTITLPSNQWISAAAGDLIRNSYFGYSTSYRLVQVGTTSGISLGADLTGNAAGVFNGWEIVVPNNRALIAPNAANNGYVGVLRVGTDNKVYLGGNDYQTLGAVILNGTSAEVVGNLTVSGTATVNGETIRAAASTNGAARGLEFYNNGNSLVFGSIKADYTSGDIVYDAGASVYGEEHIFTHGTTAGSVRFTAGSISATGNLTVNGTGTSTFSSIVDINNDLYIGSGNIIALARNNPTYNTIKRDTTNGGILLTANSNTLFFKDNGRLIIGSPSVDGGQTLQVSGTAYVSSNLSSGARITAGNGFTATSTVPTVVAASSNFDYNSVGSKGRLFVWGPDSGTVGAFELNLANSTNSSLITALSFDSSGNATFAGTVIAGTWASGNADKLKVSTSANAYAAYIVNTAASGGSYGIRLHTDATAATDLLLVATSGSGGGSTRFTVKANGTLNAPSLPTSSAGLSAGDIWNDGGTLKIV